MKHEKVVGYLLQQFNSLSSEINDCCLNQASNVA